jgi:hypothetical protein
VTAEALIKGNKYPNMTISKLESKYGSSEIEPIPIKSPKINQKARNTTDSILK